MIGLFHPVISDISVVRMETTHTISGSIPVVFALAVCLSGYLSVGLTKNLLNDK